MRKLLSLFLLIPALCQAAMIDCYSGSKRIFHGMGEDVFYTDSYIAFNKPHSKNEYFMFANCMVVMTEKEMRLADEN